jgi:hypothetical protein
VEVAGARFRCRGCGQLLTFDDQGYVPKEQLAACLGRCEWARLEDGPRPGAPGRAPAPPP